MNPEEVTGIVLCGGSGRRLGGVDKPLVRIGERALAEFVIARLRPQVSRIILSVGRDTAPYAGFGCDLVSDEEPEQGPLGGLVSCFPGIASPWVLSCPGDAPWTAPNLVQALSPDARTHGIAVAHDGRRRQNLTMLFNHEMAASLRRFYADGGRAVHRWLAAKAIHSTNLSDMAASFANINTPADLENFRRAAGVQKQR